MTREEVIEALSDTRAEFNCFDPMGRKKYRAMSESIESLQEQKTGKWIPVSERLPEEGHTYLVTIEFNDGSRGVDMDEYFSYGWDDYGLGNVGRVIAWKPEPEPYWEDNQ